MRLVASLGLVLLAVSACSGLSATDHLHVTIGGKTVDITACDDGNAIDNGLTDDCK